MWLVEGADWLMIWLHKRCTCVALLTGFDRNERRACAVYKMMNDDDNQSCNASSIQLLTRDAAAAAAWCWPLPTSSPYILYRHPLHRLLILFLLLLIVIVIVISKLLKRYSKAKRTRAPAYSRAYSYHYFQQKSPDHILFSFFFFF